MQRYRINVSSILKTLGAELEVKGEQTLPELTSGGETYAVDGNVGFDFVLQNIGSGVRVSGLVSADLLSECSRCLTSCRVPLRADVDEVFFLAGAGEEEEEEPDAYRIRHDSVELDEIIRESLLLSIPVSALCRPDCRGICPTCGQNLNERDCGHRPPEAEPRLVELKELLEK